MSVENAQTKRTRFAFYVRVTEKEYERILKMASSTKSSIQDLFKNALLHHSKLENATYLFPPEDAEKFRRDLAQLGNNVNQISRRLNSGLFQDMYPAIAALNRGFVDLNTRISINRGNR